MTDHSHSRRSFLSAIGSLGILGAAAPAAARGNGDRPPGSAGPGNDESLPVYATGTSIHEYDRVSEGYRYQHTFVSDDLAERYGDRRLSFESAILPERVLSDAVREQEQYTTRVDERLVVGTAAEHATAEATIRTAQREAGELDVEDDIPLYHYKSASDAGDQQSRKAPINLAWNDDSSATIKDTLENDAGWTQYDWLPEIPRYINDDGDVRATDEQVMDRIFFTRQWHIRLYDVDEPNYSAVGQAHRDPLNHNQGITIDDWHFDAASNESASDWPGGGYCTDFGNGSGFDSSSGAGYVQY